jgi:hypothetical protein
MSASNCPRAWLLALALLGLMTGCVSRYHIDLYLLEGEGRTKVKVEKTEFAIDAVLGDLMSTDKLVPGDGNCLILITGSRGRTLDPETKDLVRYDRYLRYRIFLQLPTDVTPGTISLADNSLVQQMGRYELAAEDKLYFPLAGTLVIDSLPGKRLFGTLNGRFENHLGDTVGFNGQFKAKVAQ